MQMNEKLASFLQEDKLDEADKLDEEMIRYCGTDGRVVINRVVAPPRPMYMYAFNRAMLQIRHYYVQEAVLSMIDVMEILHFGGVPNDIYLILNFLAEHRGKRSRFNEPFNLADDYLLMAAVCVSQFPSMALSLFWKAKTLFKRCGMVDMETFTDSFIRTQYEAIADVLEKKDQEGSNLFKIAASRITAHCVVPDRKSISRPQLVPIAQTKLGRLKIEDQRQREKILKNVKFRIKNYETELSMNSLYPKFEIKKSMTKILADRLDKKNVEELPNIFEVLDVVCYDEERYAVRCNQFAPYWVIGHDIHNEDGVIDTIVNPEGKLTYQTKNLVRNLYYRGQTKIYPACQSSLFRDLSDKQKFIEKLKLCEFSILLHTLPSSVEFDNGVMNHLANGKDEHRSIYIDDEALAQHYGIKTPYLDLTSDKWVAAFFACCDRKNNPVGERDVYEKHTKEDVGVFYVFHAEMDYSPTGTLRPIGMQPQLRPVMQAGYVQKLGADDDFSTMATAIPFRFHADCTNILYWLFEQSGLIQPPEVIELKAKRIVLEEKCFSEAAYKMCHERYYHELTDDEFMAQAQAFQLTQQTEPLVTFTAEELKQSIRDRNLIAQYQRYNTRVEQTFIADIKEVSQ